MRKEDIRLLELVKKYPANYKIVVDNDIIMVTLVGDNPDDWYDSFSDYGQDFIVVLLKHFGYNVEYC